MDTPDIVLLMVLSTRSLLENLRAISSLSLSRISSWNPRRREITLERGITLLRVMQAEGGGMRRDDASSTVSKTWPDPIQL